MSGSHPDISTARRGATHLNPGLDTEALTNWRGRKQLSGRVEDGGVFPTGLGRFSDGVEDISVESLSTWLVLSPVPALSSVAIVSFALLELRLVRAGSSPAITLPEWAFSSSSPAPGLRGQPQEFLATSAGLGLRVA